MRGPSVTRHDRYRPWARRVLRLYPTAWRERYLEEVLLVLQECPVTIWTIVDVVLGAVDVRLHPDFMPGRLTSMLHQLRTSAITIFCAVVLFSLAWTGAQEVRDPGTVWDAATRQYPALLLASTIVSGAGYVVLLALLVGGVPILVSALRDAVAHRRRGVLGLFVAPILAAAGVVAFAVVMRRASTTRAATGTPDAPWTPLAVVLQLLLVALFCGVVGGGTAAIALAIGRTHVDGRILRFALLPARLAAVAMGVGLGATLVLTALSYREAPQLAPGELAVCALVMLGAFLLAVGAVRRGGRAVHAGGDTVVWTT